MTAGSKPESVSTRTCRFSTSPNERIPSDVTSRSSGAKQSMHSSGSMTRIRSASWMQSTGQTSTHERSLMSMQGSAMMYVTAGLLYRGNQLLDELPGALVQRRADDHLVEAGRLRGPESRGIGVIRK